MLAARFSLLSYITHIRNTEPRELIHHNLAILCFQMYDKLHKFLNHITVISIIITICS